MKTLEIIVSITSARKLLINSSIDLPVGQYHAVLVIEEQPIPDSIQTSIQNAQAIFRKYIPASRQLSQELIEERRLEALDE